MKERTIYILDDRKLEWKEKHLNEIANLWNEGYSLQQIAVFMRDKRLEKNISVIQADFFLALLHLSLEGVIAEREGALLGSK